MKINLRDHLFPKGTDNAVRLEFQNRFFDYGFVQKCISEMETLSAVGDEGSPLQRLAIYALLDSAGIYRDNKYLVWDLTELVKAAKPKENE